MKDCQYLEGNNIAPATASEARTLIGKRVEYLREVDIDKSGRGYYWPRKGEVTDVCGRNIEVGGEWIGLSGLREMRLIEEPQS